MFTKVHGWKVTVLALVVIALLGLPVAAGAADAANGITSPKEGAKVSGSVDVKGFAADPNFMKWQLDILPGSDASAAAFLALGEVAGDLSYTLDTTAYPDGEYALRLRVVTADSNYTEYITKFTIANAGAKPAAAATPETAAAEKAETKAPTAAKPAAAATPETAAAEKAETTAVQAAETKAAAAPAPAMVNGITSPKEGAKVSGSVDVKGFAADPNFMKWQLDILPGSDASAAAFLALGEVPGDLSYTLVTTGYPDGEYALRLRVVRTDSNYTEYLTKFTIANAGAKPAAAVTTTETPAAEKAESPRVQAGEVTTATVTITKNNLLGSFLADEKALSLYHFTKDTPNTSNCYDQCAQLWPPFLTKGAPKAGAGVNASLLGTTTRKDGEVQVTYNGWPLYYFSKDLKAGDVNGQDYAKVWFVLSPEGKAITTSAGAPAAAAAPAVANGITSPKDGAKVSGSVDVKGYAADPNFVKWQLDILPGLDAVQAAFLTFSETPGDFSYKLDTTGYPDGEYGLRLRVVRSDSNYNEYLSKITIANSK